MTCGLFKMESKININMNGREYLKYLKERDAKKTLRNKKRNAWVKKNRTIIIIGLTVMCMVAFFMLFMIITKQVLPRPSIFQRWAVISWDALLKIGFCIVIISWLLHGVQARLSA